LFTAKLNINFCVLLFVIEAVLQIKVCLNLSNAIRLVYAISRVMPNKCISENQVVFRGTIGRVGNKRFGR